MKKINLLKNYLSNLDGIKRYAAAFSLGSIMTLAMPPVGAFYIFLISVPGFVLLTQSCPTKKSAFLAAWAFGAGYFIFGLYWVSFALFVDIANLWWLLPLAAIAGPAVLAIYYAFIPLLAWRYKSNRLIYSIIIVVSWAAIEWVRGHALTGFPWNLPGYSWHYILPVMQVNSVIGIYGLTLLTLLWSITPLIENKSLKLAIISSFVAVALFGIIRLHNSPLEQSADHTVRIVQPNIKQTMKWDPTREWENLKKQLNLNATPSELKDPITFVIWPETAVTFDLIQYPEVTYMLSQSLPNNSIGILGSLRHQANNKGGRDFFNSVSVIDKNAKIINTYSKHHLVPFGEYIPFRKYLNMTPIAAGISIIGDFSRGKGISTINLPDGLPKPSPLICYEGIFPHQVAKKANRPDWLINVTNDGWYGKTAGPHQHFEITRVRAIEEGLPLVRAANTGISGTLDPLGRVVGLKKLEKTGVLDTILPKPLPPTIYSKLGDYLFFGLLVFLIVLGELLYQKYLRAKK